MKTLTTLSVLATAFVLSGCATSWTSAPNGFALIKEDKEPAFVTDNARASKTGKACAQNVLSVYASGDSSIEAAKKEGGITKIASVDYEINNYIVYGKICTIVTGE
jgi:hypothetical protein